MAKYILISVLIVLVCLSTTSFGQTCKIEVETAIKNADVSGAKGEITLTIEGDRNDAGRYKLFLLNNGADVARKEIKDRKVSGLRPGIYEFIVIDTKVEKCFKELTITVGNRNRSLN